jgi:DNA-binding MarR family transcriptional regulator
MATVLDRTLTYRLHQLHKLTDLHSQAVYPERTGLSMSDGRCLTTIGTFEPLSVKELADKANLNKGQASRAAQALVDQGLVLKADHPGDGRGVVLTLTPAGRDVFKRAMAMIHQRNQEIFGCLTAKEQSALSTLFDRLIAHARPGVVTAPCPGNAMDARPVRQASKKPR